MQKKRVIKSLENLTPELRVFLRKRYPDGFDNHLMRIMNAKNEPIFVVPMETEDSMYLVKVAVSKNSEGEYEYDDSDDKGDYEGTEVDTDIEPTEGSDFEDD